MKYFTFLLVFLLNSVLSYSIEWRKIERDIPAPFVVHHDFQISSSGEVCYLSGSVNNIFRNDTNYINITTDYGKTWKRFTLDKYQKAMTIDSRNRIVIGTSSKGLAIVNSNRDSLTMMDIGKNLASDCLNEIDDGKYLSSEWLRDVILMDIDSGYSEILYPRGLGNNKNILLAYTFFDKKNKRAYSTYIDDCAFKSTDNGQTWDSVSSIVTVESGYGIFSNGEDVFYNRLYNHETDTMYLGRLMDDFQLYDTLMVYPNIEPSGFLLNHLLVSAAGEYLIVGLYYDTLFFSDDYGNTFTKLNNPLPDVEIRKVYVSNKGEILLRLRNADIYYGNINTLVYEKNEPDKEIFISPNPVERHGKLKVHLNFEIYGQVNIIVRDIIGRLCYQNKYFVQGINENEIFLDCDLVPGVYFIELYNKNKYYADKFIVE